ncbi:hypothetical protein TELCIR_21348, partial [Teladorsagia circumcincta]
MILIIQQIKTASLFVETYGYWNTSVATASMNVNPFHSQQQPTLGEATSIGDKLASLHSEMASLRLECDRLINKHLLVEKTLSE